MNFKYLLMSGTQRIFRRLGHSVEFYPLTQDPSLHKALWRLRGHAIPFETLVDVGASDAFWSRALAAQFPEKRHLLLEANRIYLPALEKACLENKNWSFRMTAVGGESGTLFFDDSDPLGGHLSAAPLTEKYKPCQVATIDEIVAEQRLSGPFMIKLDTHGVEIPILDGATKTLETTNVLVIEAYNFTFGEVAVPFWELCRHMLQLGFRPLDLFDILYREVDNAFWQFDLLFARADLPLFRDSRYFINERH